MDLKSIVKELDKGTPRPVYVCCGTEKFRMQEFLQFVLNKCVPEENRDFAVSRYDLTETPLDDVLEDAGTMPFMAERKVVIASNALFLTGAKESGKIEHRTEKLLEYMKFPAEFSVLVLTVDADKLDERKKIVKTLKDAGVVLTFSPLTAEDLAQWVKRRADSLGVTFGPGAVEAFLLSGGTNLQSLSSELEKLSLYAGRGGTITAETVEQLVVRSTEQDVFVLIDDIVRLRKDRALTILYELLKRREEPIKIAMLMTRQFRMMLQVKELERQGYSQQQMAGTVGAHPYAVKIAAEQSRRFSFQQLAEILSQLGDMDYGMKSGKVDKVLGLEMFILKLAV
ncbi:DNA polymerase III subunit delta [Gorillibacterium sp. sgz5001074]|uniref:DNA polymerase III subunit delta n=1 Tax=Gorillibacterium sp. sgz5001074 TaxID=3446695 RepID=UPI003F67D651